MKADSSEAKNRITQYSLASQPIIVTYNGQRQGYFPNTVVKNDLKLPYLERYIVVHVDCDGLDNDSRRQLFTPTRESLKETSLGDNLRQIITETLREDDNLRRLDLERKHRYVKNVDSSSVENIRRRLAKRVAVFRSGSGRSGPRGSGPSEKVSVSKPLSIPTQDPPTFIRITSANPRTVHAGRTFTLKFETDARPDYFREPGTFIAAISPPSFGSFTGLANVLDGHGKAFFRASSDAQIEEVAEIVLEVRPPRSPTIRATAHVEVVAPPEKGGDSPGRDRTPNINPSWVAQGEDHWNEWGWTEKSVAKVMADEESIDVFVSAGNRRLDGLIARAQRQSTQAVDAIKDFYLEHIAYHALVAEMDEERAEGAFGDGEEDPAPYLDFEFKHACDTVCGIIESLFEMFITGAMESEPVHSEETVSAAP